MRVPWIDRRCPPQTDQGILARLDLPCRLMVLIALATRMTAVAGDELTHGVQAPPGFEVRLFADDQLAPDIYSLTIDAAGRVVVSSRGYVRILRDQDGDGVAESFQQFADGPANGAMGMFWDGPDLICTGDAGLLRYRDADGDDRADGPPELLLAAKTGGEHDIHAIRKGPDGWWYLIGGNNANLDERYVTLPSSPVTSPKAGALMRLTPDFANSEVIADGFRNAYDFAFNAEGRLFTYDSDGERDVSLPWYRPTRVFEILSGAHAGWLSRSWKRPGYFLDMPPVVAKFGRGSPTGVESYRHTQFPDEYRGGLFVLDWTYGRVMFVPPVDGDGRPLREPEEFLTGVGSFGFAPTDAAIGPDGSLFVSVGGRGTRGGVYRVRWPEGEGDAARPSGTPLDECLRAPQPLSSWSRAKWEPLLADLKPDDFRAAALDAQRPAAERVRAIEILCEHFGGLDEETAKRLLNSPSADVRARAAWSLGRRHDPSFCLILAKQMADNDVTVVRASAEALLGFLRAEANGAAPPFDPGALFPALSMVHRPTRQAVARVLARLDQAAFETVTRNVAADDIEGRLTLAYAGILRDGDERWKALHELRNLQVRELSPDRSVRIVRLMQLALGDVGPGQHAPVFDGYAVEDLPQDQRDLGDLGTKLATRLPGEDDRLDHELARLIAILQPDDPDVLAKVLHQVTSDSHPIEDVHYLIVAARLPAPRTEEQTKHVAASLLAIDDKIQRLGLHRDRNWDDRVGEMFAALVEHDPRLPEQIVQQESFGQPGHITYVERFSGDLERAAARAFIRAIRADPNYRWNNEIVRLLSTSEREDVRELLKSQAEEFAVQSSVLIALAKRPQPEERELFVGGLQSSDLGVLRQMVAALETLGPGDSATEQVALVRTLRRVGEDDGEQALKQAILSRLERNTGLTLTTRIESNKSRETLRDVTELWTAWVRQQHPEEWAAQTGASVADADQLGALLDEVDWTTGSPQRGETLFQKRACAECHGGRRALGPDLRGSAGRFSREDLFRAIALPNRDVSPRYQTTLIVTDDGRPHTGIIIYESIDGLLLRNGRGETVRIEADQIDVRRRLTASLMPGGLLNDLRPSDLADLYAYLQTLR